MLNKELKRKIAEVSHHCNETSMRLFDYFGNVASVLNNESIILRSGKYTIEDIQKIRLEFSGIAQKIISLNHEDIVLQMRQNPPVTKGTQGNIEALKQTFLQ